MSGEVIPKSGILKKSKKANIKLVKLMKKASASKKMKLKSVKKVKSNVEANKFESSNDCDSFPVKKMNRIEVSENDNDSEDVAKNTVKENEEIEDEVSAPQKGIKRKREDVEMKKSQKRKELREKRRKLENKNYELSEKAKQIWEEARNSECPKNQRESLINQLMKLIKGNVKNIIRAHDTVRVIEFIVAEGNDKHRTELFEELKDEIVELSKLKYAKFFVKKMLDYGSQEQKNFIIQSFYGRVKKILNHTEASSVLEMAFNEVAKAKQRALLIQEYFGDEFKIFKDDKTLTLSHVLEKVNSSQKEKIMTQMKEELIKLTNKNSIRHSIVHFVLREFFDHADIKMKQEVIENIREAVVEILHTKPGSRVAMQCLWFGTTKDRKAIIKSFKKFVTNIAQEEQGHLVLLAAFDCVDDTKLVEKVILTELFAKDKLKDLIQNKYAIKVFQYILTPRDSRWFHKDVIAILKKGDDNPISKKDRNVREDELRTAASPYLLKLVENQSKNLLLTGSSSLLLLNILTNAKGSKTEAVKAVCKIMAEEGVYDGDQHAVERGPTFFAIKKLIIQDSRNRNKFDDSFFSKNFVDIVPSTVLRSYIGCNRGCFLLISLLETEIDYVSEKVKKALVGVNSTLREKTYKGAHLLLDLLKTN